MFDNVNDAEMRLMNSVIRLDDNLFQVESVYRDGSGETKNILLAGQLLSSGERIEGLDINNPRLNYLPIPLGYINYKGTAYHLARMPERRWKQGLTREALYVSPPGRVRTNQFFSKALQSSVEGKYPPLAVCIELVDSMVVESIAFNRSFAVLPEFLLQYRGSKIVGEFNKKQNKLVLHNRFTFLEEMLKEA